MYAHFEWCLHKMACFAAQRIVYTFYEQSVLFCIFAINSTSEPSRAEPSRVTVERDEHESQVNEKHQRIQLHVNIWAMRLDFVFFSPFSHRMRNVHGRTAVQGEKERVSE